MSFSLTRFTAGNEIDTGRTMKLAYNDTFSAIDDEFATTKHDRNIAKINLFFDWLTTSESQSHPERSTIRHAKLTAFVRNVPRFSETVFKEFELDGFVVTFNRKNFAKYSLNALVFPLISRNIVLQEYFVKSRLYFSEIWDRVTNATTSEMTNFRWL